MAEKKVGRPRTDRPTTTTRVYEETLQVARILCMHKDVTMADLLEELVQAEAKRLAPQIMKNVQGLLGGADK